MGSFIVARFGDEKVKITGSKQFCSNLLNDKNKLALYLKGRLSKPENECRFEDVEKTALLIDLIKPRLPLWNHTMDPGKRTLQIKTKLWEEGCVVSLGIFCNVPHVGEVEILNAKKKWFYLRKQYQRCHKGNNIGSKWRYYYKKMHSFLKELNSNNDSVILSEDDLSQTAEYGKEPRNKIRRLNESDSMFVETSVDKFEPGILEVELGTNNEVSPNQSIEKSPSSKTICSPLQSARFHPLPPDNQIVKTEFPVINLIPCDGHNSSKDDTGVNDEVDGFMKQIRALMIQMPGAKRTKFAIYSLIKAQQLLYGVENVQEFDPLS